MAADTGQPDSPTVANETATPPAPPAEDEGTSSAETESLLHQVTGAFEIRTHATHPAEIQSAIEFNIRPREEFPGTIPEEQREINYGIYGTWGVLKLLREQGVFNNRERAFTEYRERLLQVAEVGLEAKRVRTHLAAKALEQIREEISLREGITIKLQYLLRLAVWALFGVFFGVVLSAIAMKDHPGLSGFGPVVIGSMVGAWMSVASTRRSVAFEEMPDFLSSQVEPFIRLLFVGFLAVSLALFLQLDLLTLQVPGVKFNEFSEDVGVALILGLVAGISEKAVSVRIISRAQSALAPSNP